MNTLKSLLGTMILAPLSGCADLSFRLIARAFGARLCFFEMIDANALLNNHPRTLRILKTHKKDTPTAVQLLGSDPRQFVDAAHKILDYVSVPLIDINCACPVKKVLKKKAGARLLESPNQIKNIVKTMVVSLPVPITIKMRVGIKINDIQRSILIAKTCQDAGASALFIHGRTQEQAYRGGIHYDTIKQIKAAVAIPVFGSGNVLSPVLAKKMIDETRCDGLLIARGAFGNPWIFKDIQHYLEHGVAPPTRTVSEKIAVLKKHLHYVQQYNEFKPAGKIGFMRKIAQWYIREIPSARTLRDRITQAKNYERLVKLIDTLV